MANPPKAPSKAAAARAEKADDGKTYDWRGLTFNLPPELPGVLLFDWAELEGAVNEVKPIVDFLKSLLGEDQVAQVRAKIVEDNVKFDEVAEVLMSLINDVFGVYGTAEGESEASQE